MAAPTPTVGRPRRPRPDPVVAPVGRRRHLPVLGAHAALTAVVLWPAVRHLRTRPMVGTGDSSIFVWAWWNLDQALRHGSNPLRTDRLFHPVGVDLSVTVTAPLVGLASWPVRVLLGPTAQVNVVQLGAAFAAAALTYALLDHLGIGRVVAAVAAAAYAFTPFRFVHVGEHLNLVNTWVLPLGALLAVRLLERPGSRRRAAALGAALGATVLVEPQLAVITGAGVALLLWRRWPGPRPGLRTAVAGLGTAALVAAPVALPMALGLLGGASSAPPPAGALPAFSSRLSSWVLPSPWDPVLGGLNRIPALATPLEGIAAPGLVVLVLAVVGQRVVAERDRRGWVALTLAGVVLSLGPYVSVGHEYAPIPLPYAALRLLPMADSMRVPGRFALLGVFGLCVLGAQAADALLARRQGSRRWLVPGLLVALLVVELWPGPLSSRAGGAPRPYRAIAADQGTGAVLEVPLQWSTGVRLVGFPDRDVSVFEAWAAVAGHPSVGGSVSRFPDASLARLERLPLYRQVRSLQGDPGRTEAATFDAADLAAAGIGYVVYHRDLPVPAALRYLLGLHLPVLADDGVVIAWRVPGA